MEFSELIDIATSFCTGHPLLAVFIGALLALYAWREPKEAFKIAAVLVLLGVVLYFLTLFGQTTSTAILEKDEMIYKTRDALDK